jgi:2-polyprenyl-3-methyl-5-hydroxy-6-metoxy-1,4-benzoquinol methylase
MERAEWLKQMRGQAESLYDLISPRYWVTFGLYENKAHHAYLQRFLVLVDKDATILSAACGAGRYDGVLIEAGHPVVGIDQSEGMLARAREHFPLKQFTGVRYEKMGLQEMNFREEFEGAICMDAMEHVCPEDWPGVMQGFQKVLKPVGILYFTVEEANKNEIEAAYQKAKGQGLPVVFGEMVYEMSVAYEQARALGRPVIPGELANAIVYHFYPSLERVRAWIGQAGITIVEEGAGSGYHHFLTQKKT